MLGVFVFFLAKIHLTQTSPVSTTASSTSYTGKTNFGIFVTGSNEQQAGNTLGVHYLRMGINVLNPTTGSINDVTSAESAGFQVVMGMSNGGRGSAAAGPVTNDAAYQAAFAADLDKTHPVMITIETEEDDPLFWSGTPAQYLHMLTLATQVAHEKGYKITNGGIDSSGVSLAYWNHLWSTGDHAGADAYAQAVLVPLSKVSYPYKNIMTEIPNSQNPSIPILQSSPTLSAKLIRLNELIAGYHATGIDYINLHWYDNNPAVNAAAVTWLEQTTGLQAMSNAIGVFETSPTNVTNMLTEVVALHMPYAIWFDAIGKDGEGPNIPLTDSAGTSLLPNGVAFKNFVTSQ